MAKNVSIRPVISRCPLFHEILVSAIIFSVDISFQKQNFHATSPSIIRQWIMLFNSLLDLVLLFELYSNTGTSVVV